MRGASFTMEVLRPKAPRDAVDMLGRHPDAIPLAGGTDFMVAWNAGELNGKKILDLSALKDWSRIRTLQRGLRFGSLVNHWQIQSHAGAQKAFPLLVDACGTIGGAQIQIRGTLGGNIANASPAGDTFPSLAVYEASISTVSPRGERTIPFSEIFTGVKKTSLGPSELIEKIEIPFLAGRPRRQMFWKVGTRAASAISKTVAAGLLWMKRDGNRPRATVCARKHGPHRSQTEKRGSVRRRQETDWQSARRGLCPPRKGRLPHRRYPLHRRVPYGGLEKTYSGPSSIPRANNSRTPSTSRPSSHLVKIYCPCRWDHAPNLLYY